MGVSTPPNLAGGIGQRTSDELASAERYTEIKANPEPHSNEVFASHHTAGSGDAPGSDDEAFQRGVQRVRAMTTIWSKWTLVSTLVLLYLIEFVGTLYVYVDLTLNPYITSSFGKHGLLNIGNILSSIISGCTPLALAKVIDIWGRIEGFLAMLLVCLLGMIMKAVCQNVETYIAAHVLYRTGYIGMTYVVGVLVSDMTTLRNRMIMLGINETPRIASTFAGPAIAQLFYTNLNFRWAFGAFAIILAGCSVPAIILMTFMICKASKQGVLRNRRSSERTWYQSTKHYIIELDLVGILLIAAALSSLLLPFSLARYAPQGWSTPYIIVMVVLGVVLFVLFYLWESKLAPTQFLAFEFLKQGTIIGSCLLTGIMFLSNFCWNGYFGSYLQVVHRQSITNANYILNAYSLTSTVFAPIIGALISWTGNFKWAAFCGVPLMLLGTALIIPLRSPDAAIGVLALTQVLVGLGASFFMVCSSIAIMAPVTHQQIAAVNALSGLFRGVGSSIGYAIAGGIWNNMLPTELYNRLPEPMKNQSKTIFGDIVLQMSFPDGSPEREAVVGAYSHVMRLMVIAGACFMPLCLLSIICWRNINVKKLEEVHGKQTKGTVF
ncbi:major facilitator superfamily protein [Hirsutella rhossiliensis]|uniref:Major facilitator superfamily domain-containing protein n=1 Tax=Hirsutella rhossiliensis TaxID=111463 RepID=A0A9P8MMF5_9HYPO|nr:major facilitator superfamily domain-containing protein [Hirsutella rhossiliensis]KAH0957074.1 major facilitator superfamily domain-containing protein [Hirsutella rhossiliensis]